MYKIKFEQEAKKPPAARMRILALHGSGSNSEVTKIQLDNISFLKSEYDVIYANGPISTQQPGPGLSELEGLVTGPWYSWLVLVNLNRTLLFESFQTSLATYRRCSNEIFPDCNTAYNRSHLASYADA